jgi:hypothetical protein
LQINLGEAEDQCFQLFEPERRVLEAPGASLRFIKKRFRQSEKGFGQQPVNLHLYDLSLQKNYMYDINNRIFGTNSKQG